MSGLPSCDDEDEDDDDEPSELAPEPPGQRLKHYTLVEILIIGLIVTIASVLVIPRWSGAAQRSASRALLQDLQFMRQQIDLYRVQHHHVSPGYPQGDVNAAPSAQLFISQLTMPTSDAGVTNVESSTAHPLGPYLAEIPRNPINGGSKVLIVANDADIPVPDDVPGDIGWVFRPQTCELRAYLSGADENGAAYFNY